MEDFILTEDNYYSQEADRRYMSVHQFIDFAGYMGIEGCEERAMAKLNGDYVIEKSDAFLVGSFVDSFFEGSLEKFKGENPQIFTKSGELKAQYKRAEKMIERCLQDDLFMQFMSGEKQKIFTAPMFGCEWKCKLDSYIPGVAIVDLKTTANLHKSWNVRDYGKVTFVEYFGYTVQLAVYQKIVEIVTGEKLPCYIAAVTKEDIPEIELIGIDQQTLDHALNYVESNMPSVLSVKEGTYEPTRCNHCEYCKMTKKLESAIPFTELIYED